MSADASSANDSLDWQRITAFGAAIALHAIAVAIVAIPVARLLPRLYPPIAEVRILELKPPQPALAIPPEPRPPPRTRIEPASAVAPVRATPVATTPTPTEALISHAPTLSTAVAHTGNVVPSGMGESRTLAYAGPLRLKYPANSMRQREQGTVLLRVLVDIDGNVQRIEIERGSGHPQLDRAAREAVQTAHFRPVLRDGQAIAAWGLVPIQFRLDRL